MYSAEACWDGLKQHWLLDLHAGLLSGSIISVLCVTYTSLYVTMTVICYQSCF